MFISKQNPQAMNKNIGIIIGSLRKDSLNRRMANAILKEINKSFNYQEINISDLAFYNEDIDQGTPPMSYINFRNSLDRHDAFLFFTPEYNRSIPAVLKNALDVGSRPYAENKWDNKPAGIISVSPSTIGAFGANHHLRQCCTFLNIPVLQQPEMYIGSAHTLLDENGIIKSNQTRDFLQAFMNSFELWVSKF